MGDLGGMIDMGRAGGTGGGAGWQSGRPRKYYMQVNLEGSGVSLSKINHIHIDDCRKHILLLMNSRYSIE